MTHIKARPPQTKIKHTILEKYLNAWGGIIVNGLRSRVKDLYFVYVDCNASNGRFNGELEDSVAYRGIQQPVWGSPLIGIKALDDHASWVKEKVGITLHTTSILLEKEAKTFCELKHSLEIAGFADRVRETGDFLSLQDGEIATLCADSTSMASQLVRYTQSGYKFSFFVLDPYGPKGIPLDFVHQIISQPRHDVLIYMPYLDLLRKSGLVSKFHRSSTDEKLLNNYNAMFGNEGWQNIVRALDIDEMGTEQESFSSTVFQINNTTKAGDVELDFVNCYKNALLLADPSLAIKSIDLHFPDKERTMYYLYLTTHNPTGALQMNKVLWDAGYQEYELRWKLRQAKKFPGQMLLFDNPVAPSQASLRPPKEELERQILSLLEEKALTKRSLYTAFADEPYFAEEIDKALRSLRKQKEISFPDNLRHDTRITIEKK